MNNFKPALSAIRLLAITGFCIMLLSQTSCSGKQAAKDTSYVDQYLNALQTFKGVEIDEDKPLQLFSKTFSDLKQAELRDLLKEVYAEEIYFNDTIRTFTRREDMIEYLFETGNKVLSTRIEIEDIANHGNNYYLRWTMLVQFELSGRTVESKSIGMTHLRFNTSNKVILHQDYWDGVQGFYQYVPIVGYLIKKVKSKL